MYITGNNLAQLKQHVASQPDLNSYIQKHTISYTGTVRLTTDDWPYLYIERAAIPQMYLVIIIALVILFIAANRFLMSMGEDTVNLHFFFLGSAFMLLEFQNVSKSALLFDSTWIVNSYIISAILALILLANVCVYYFSIKNVLPVYAILLASVLITYFIPLDVFNSLGYPAKSILVSLILNIPIFFASLIFITSFSNAPLKNTALGSNLMGAALGGLLEPFSFVIGIKALLIIVFLLYLLSYVTLAKPDRGLVS
jgi:hypothetical protein